MKWILNCLRANNTQGAPPQGPNLLHVPRRACVIESGHATPPGKIILLIFLGIAEEMCFKITHVTKLVSSGKEEGSILLSAVLAISHQGSIRTFILRISWAARALGVVCRVRGNHSKTFGKYRLQVKLSSVLAHVLTVSRYNRSKGIGRLRNVLKFPLGLQANGMTWRKILRVRCTVVREEEEELRSKDSLACPEQTRKIDRCWLSCSSRVGVGRYNSSIFFFF